jgi:hypothetical protein
MRIARDSAMRTVLVLTLGVVAGCGGNDSVWSSSVSRLVLSRSGGFLPPSQPTADCPRQGVEYTLVVAGRALSAWSCTPGPAAPHPLVRTNVARPLSDAEFDGLVAKLEALRVVSVDTCGADKPEVTVTVTTPSGTTEYGDSFYSCIDSDDRPKIESATLDAAAGAFGQLAFSQP